MSKAHPQVDLDEALAGILAARKAKAEEEARREQTRMEEARLYAEWLAKHKHPDYDEHGGASHKSGFGTSSRRALGFRSG